MELNREAVYDTVPYKIYGEGPTAVADGGFNDGNVKEFTSSDFRFLAGHGCIYIIALRPAENGEYLVKTFAKKQGAFNTKIESITCPGSREGLKYEHTADGLAIRYKTKDEMPVVFRIGIA